METKKKEKKPSIKVVETIFGECAIVEVFGQRITIAKEIRDVGEGEKISFVDRIGIHGNKSIGVIWFNGMQQVEVGSAFEVEKMQEIEKAVRQMRASKKVMEDIDK